MARDQADIREFLESGVLEEYLIGAADEQTSRKVELYIDKYDEVSKAWIELQETFESIALDTDVKAPAEIKLAIENQINHEKTKSQKPKVAAVRRMNRIIVAASVAAFLFATLAIVQRSSVNQYKQEVAELTQRINALEDELDEQNRQFAALETQYSVINDPNTQKVIINGNDNARGFVLVAYWNEQEQSSFMQIVNQPELPQKQCFQLWADVDGEMVNMGVIPNENGLIALDFKVDAESLNVTIEPDGGSEHPTVSRLVGSVAI